MKITNNVQINVYQNLKSQDVVTENGSKNDANLELFN